MASFAQLNQMANAIPVGRYALSATNGTDDVYFFEIRKVGASHRIFRLIGAPGDFHRRTMNIKWQERALRKISIDPAMWIRFFGMKTRVCGACQSPLTHARSRACGMGPKCAPKWGVKW